jgi:hypothetical protein
MDNYLAPNPSELLNFINVFGKLKSWFTFVTNLFVFILNKLKSIAMKQFLLKHKKTVIGTAAVLLIGGITMSFQDSPFSYNRFTVQDTQLQQDPPKKYCNDTVPEKNYHGSMTMKEFDNLQNVLDKTLVDVMDQVKKIDLSKIQKDVEAALKSVDMEKIMRDVNLSLKNVDLDKIMADVNLSLKNIDWKDKDGEIEKAMKEVQKELEKVKLELKDIDKEAIQKEMEKAKLEIEKSKTELGKLEKIDMDKIMKEAKEGIEEGKTELRLIKEMFNEMEKDGLIDPKKGFTIEYKDKDLYIDGKKQSEKTTDKYRKYIKDDHFKITIEKE